MKIHFARTGGFAGMRTEATFDTATLPEETARELEALVAEACFFDLPETPPASFSPDTFQYVVTVENDDRRHTVRTGEGAAPDALQPLLRRLTVLARSPSE